MAEEFDLVRCIYRSCALSSFWLGLLLNIFLIWLILKKTPAPMQIYNKLLLAPCFLCILIAINTFLVQPIPIVEHGFHAIIQNGPLRNMPQPWNYTANVLWFQMLLLFVCCTTVQFAFRYYMLTRDGQIPLKLKYLTGFLVYMLLVAHVALHYWSDYPNEEQQGPSMVQLAARVHAQLGITKIRFSSFTWASSWSWILHCLAMIAIFAVCYWIIVFCFIKTRRFVAKTYGNKNVEIKEGNKMRINERKREYNAQVTTAFIVQAVLPTIEVIELTIQTTLPILFPSHRTVHFMVYAAIPLYFIPVLNSLATMMLVKPYQIAVLRMLGLIVGRRDKVIVVGGIKERKGKNGGGNDGMKGNGNGQPTKEPTAPARCLYVASPHGIQPIFTLA